MDAILVFDLVCEIARIDDDAWYKMTLISEGFRIYSKTDAGIQEFLKLFNIKRYITYNNMSYFGFSLFGKLHYRHEDDLPAVERNSDGIEFKEWFLNGIYDRKEGLPAIVRPDAKYWFVGGKQGREGDLPAVELGDGSLLWFKDGFRHRDGDKPCAIYPNGTMEWRINDELHREYDKPARIRAGSYSEIWYEGRYIRSYLE